MTDVTGLGLDATMSVDEAFMLGYRNGEADEHSRWTRVGSEHHHNGQGNATGSRSASDLTARSRAFGAVPSSAVKRLLSVSTRRPRLRFR